MYPQHKTEVPLTIKLLNARAVNLLLYINKPIYIPQNLFKLEKSTKPIKFVYSFTLPQKTPLTIPPSPNPAIPKMSTNEQQSKADLIAERQANLPLPEDPPVASDFNSADGSTVNVGSGRTSGTSDGALREPASGQALPKGREVDGKLPNDAVAQGAKNKQGLADTTK